MRRACGCARASLTPVSAQPSRSDGDFKAIGYCSRSTLIGWTRAFMARLMAAAVASYQLICALRRLRSRKIIFRQNRVIKIATSFTPSDQNDVSLPPTEVFASLS